MLFLPSTETIPKTRQKRELYSYFSVKTIAFSVLQKLKCQNFLCALLKFISQEVSIPAS